MKYDDSEQKLSIEADSSELTGLYQIYVDLVDSKNKKSSQTYLLSLVIVDESLVQEEEEPKMIIEFSKQQEAINEAVKKSEELRKKYSTL